MNRNGLTSWIYNNPAWLVTFTFLGVALVIASIGLVLVYTITSRTTRERHGELTSFTVTNIAVLYAVLLAFIAVATWELFSRASHLAQTEATLAGNLFRDTLGLPKPVDGDLRNWIREYLQVVIEEEWPQQRDGVVPEDGWPILAKIHQSIVAINPANLGQAVLMQEMLRDLNELYSARTSRLDAVQGHIPDMVWSVIIAVGALTVGYSCFVRSDGMIVHLLMLAGLTIALTLVVALIVEMDYPFRGSISVSVDSYQLVLDGLTLSAPP